MKGQPLSHRLWAKVDKSGDCWLWTGKVNDSGYGVIRNVLGVETKCHRVAYVLANGYIPHGLCVLHRCDNRRCCNPSHLFLGTRGDNNRDRSAKGRTARGARLPHSKLTEQDKAAIAALNGRETQAEVGARFGVSRSRVGQIWSQS